MDSTINPSEERPVSASEIGSVPSEPPIQLNSSISPQNGTNNVNHVFSNSFSHISSRGSFRASSYRRPARGHGPKNRPRRGNKVSTNHVYIRNGYEIPVFHGIPNLGKILRASVQNTDLLSEHGPSFVDSSTPSTNDSETNFTNISDIDSLDADQVALQDSKQQLVLAKRAPRYDESNTIQIARAPSDDVMSRRSRNDDNASTVPVSTSTAVVLASKSSSQNQAILDVTDYICSFESVRSEARLPSTVSNFEEQENGGSDINIEAIFELFDLVQDLYQFGLSFEQVLTKSDVESSTLKKVWSFLQLDSQISHYDITLEDPKENKTIHSQVSKLPNTLRRKQLMSGQNKKKAGIPSTSFAAGLKEDILKKKNSESKLFVSGVKNLTTDHQRNSCPDSSNGGWDRSQAQTHLNLELQPQSQPPEPPSETKTGRYSSFPTSSNHSYKGTALLATSVRQPFINPERLALRVRRTPVAPDSSKNSSLRPFQSSRKIKNVSKMSSPTSTRTTSPYGRNNTSINGAGSTGKTEFFFTNNRSIEHSGVFTPYDEANKSRVFKRGDPHFYGKKTKYPSHYSYQGNYNKATTRRPRSKFGHHPNMSDDFKSK